MHVLALNCTLKASREASSTGLLLQQTLTEFESRNVTTTLLRMGDYKLEPGVTSDEGDGDEWPRVRKEIMAADILLLGTPIWLGQPSSVCKRVLERMDAFLSETDAKGHMPSYGKVAAVAVVGNEDGAHHVAAELYQALNDVGFTLAANAVTYWVGEAMHGKDYKDLPSIPEKVVGATSTLVSTSLHLAEYLKTSPYPALK